MQLSSVRTSTMLVLLLAASALAHPQTAGSASATNAIRVGAVFPLRGPMSPLAREEYRGVQIAREFVNADGGVRGRSIELVTRELDTPSQSKPVMRALRAAHVNVVVGAYSSALSIPASAAAAHYGLVYWEAGAVADRLTGRGFPSVFRVGASGSNLGSNAARFAAVQLAHRLSKSPASIRVSVVFARDAYAESVATAAIAQARAHGMHVVSQSRYDPYLPDWNQVIKAVRGAHPDILILASHIADGVAFRRAFLAAHLYVSAFIGSTMAQCVPEFGALLGKDAIGVFASDRPMGGFNSAALNPAGRAIYRRFAATWRRQTGQRQPPEEGLAGFTAAWGLFHDVLPRAARSGSLTTASVVTAARSVTLPDGSLPNGAGLRFATDRKHLGQNLRAAAVIWQWQGIRHSVVVWPRIYATGKIEMVPLPR